LKVISVSVNGQMREFDAPISVAMLVEKMQLAGRRIALEQNGEIVPRGRFEQQMLAHGDKLEIVVAVGGG
jgi:sulfur carrier protein